ncbi:MAG: sulfatase [Hyphomonadaceae bacterium]
MIKKLALGLLALVVVAGGAAWLNRKAIILYIATNSGKVDDIAPNHPVPWQAGPEAVAETPADAAADNATDDDAPRPPNIIFILADDLGINDLSTFGGGVAGGRVPTPNIDRLAREGAIFRQAYAGTASCAPSRAMIMTGRYPTRTGFEFTPTPDGMGRIVSMFSENAASGLPRVDYDGKAEKQAPPFRSQGLPGSEVTIAEVLKQAGYHTVHIGKWHTGLGPEFGPNAQGFDESLLMASGLYMREDDPDVVNAKLSFDPIDKFLWARMQFAAAYNEGDWFEPGGYLTDYWTDEAIKVIHANRNRPFFLNVAHWGVHTPLQATKEDFEAVGDIEPHRLRVYAAMVRALDRSVGRLLDALDEEGLADNTVIVFTSDNGGAGYIGLPEINQPYRGWKLTLFEGGIRVPMFVRWPGHVAPGTLIDDPVAHIDLMPTFASLGQAPLPEGVEIDGRDLAPYALGQAAPDARPHDTIFWESGYYRVVRHGDWKLQATERPEKMWLFNLADDPTEKHDLSTERPEVVAELKALLDEHRASAVPPLYPSTTQSPIAIDKTSAERVTKDDEYLYWPN